PGAVGAAPAEKPLAQGDPTGGLPEDLRGAAPERRRLRGQQGQPEEDSQPQGGGQAEGQPETLSGVHGTSARMTAVTMAAAPQTPATTATASRWRREGWGRGCVGAESSAGPRPWAQSSSAWATA